MQPAESGFGGTSGGIIKEAHLSEPTEQFTKRKRDHITSSLNQYSQVAEGAGFEKVNLLHEALPDADFSDVGIETTLFNHRVKALYINSMTAGHDQGVEINRTLAQASQKNKWVMGVGSQRRELTDKSARREWIKIRELAPQALLIGNIGLAQAITCSTKEIQEIVDSLSAAALFIHTNPVQETLQAEGTPQFKGSLEALKRLCAELNVPVILKETGCGFSPQTLKKLVGTGLYAVDISGYGGTHWGRVEGLRLPPEHPHHMASQTFANWGISTVDSLLNAKSVQPDYKIWASGGVRNGLHAAKCVALGAEMVGIAQPIMAAAIAGPEKLQATMEQFELTLKMAMYFSGHVNVDDFRKNVSYHLS